MTERNFKLMPDYGCHAVWETTGGMYENTDPSDLPISPTLADRLVRWSARYDDTLNQADPIRSGFESSQERLAFEVEGRALLKELKLEMPQAEFIYFSVETDQFDTDSQI